MKSAVLVLLVCCSSLFAQSIFVATNNHSSNEMRKKLLSDTKKGKSCLTLTDDPSQAELRLDLVEGDSRSGFFHGDLNLPSVSAMATNKAGVVVFRADTGIAWGMIYRRLRAQFCSSRAE